VQARETLRVMLMVQRRKRVLFTAKFKETLEKERGPGFLRQDGFY
jgi:hypothetical protein